MNVNVTGSVKTTVNIRSSATDSISNIVGKLYSGNTFSGSEIVVDSLGRKWIKLNRINGSVISTSYNQYVASWVVTFSILEVVEPATPVTTDLGIPTKIETVEYFESGETRKTVWENPTVTAS